MIWPPIALAGLCRYVDLVDASCICRVPFSLSVGADSYILHLKPGDRQIHQLRNLETLEEKVSGLSEATKFQA
ncbi:uncharacterized protein B0I36DRAFT_16467 [Microdochium trichocladiopsis]|uniref:Uncharacterized protein n=1 Tax=Microdochium trichocladiopsis TaxID=1682393 RepID=A0A9P9BWK5_9PEZI|nr:uncharacterized protein B0I36DRAFT_16467 [Microdochium trichocladiopsis]KAH7040887.1 hypothetical protein B0I36DRAFT_16467 [Microdochium trichocladiopsis]